MGKDKRKQWKEANNFKTPDAKPTSSGRVGRLDDQTLAYYRRVSETLDGEFETAEERELFINNVCKQCSKEALRVSQNQTVSHIVEGLLRLAGRRQLTALFEAFSHDWQLACCDRFAGYVMQTLLLCASKYIGAPDSCDDNVDDDVDDISSLDDLFTRLVQFLLDDIALYMQHTYASHVVRVVIEVLAGEQVGENIVRSKVSRGVQDEKKAVAVNKLPDSYRPLYHSVCSKIMGLEKLEDHTENPLSNPVLQTVLSTLKATGSEQLGVMCRQLIGNRLLFATIDDKALPRIVTHPIGSHLAEQLFVCLPADMSSDLWCSRLQGHVMDMALHPVANFVLQKLIACTQSEQQFKDIFTELIDRLEDAFAANHVGVVVKLADGCARLGMNQKHLVMALQKTFHCFEPTDRQSRLVPLLLSMTTYDLYVEESPSDDAKSETGAKKVTEVTFPPLTEVTYHGSTLTQTLLRFGYCKPVVTGLLLLTPEELCTIACDSFGSHVIDAFVKSQTVGDRNRDALYKKLVGVYVNIACTKAGSRTFDTLWNAATLPQKCIIAEDLARHEARLHGDKFGFFVHSRCGIANFVRRRDEWKEMQGGQSKKRKLFKEILHEGGHKKQKRH